MDPIAQQRIRLNGPATACMVIGCGKVALYRNPVNSKGVHHGYCRAHRALAIPRTSEHALVGQADFLSRLDRDTHEWGE